MMRRLFATVIVMIALVLVGTQLFLPSLVEQKMSESLQSAVPGAPIDVRLSAFPALRLLTGSVGKFAVDVRDFALNGLTVAHLAVEARNLDVDVAGVWRGETLPVRGGGSFVIQVVVTEDALTDYINDTLAWPGDVRAEVRDDGVRVSGDVRLGETTLPVVVVGRFEPADGTAITFVVDDLMVEGARLPTFMLTVLKEAYRVRIDLDDAPLPLFVDEIVHEQGQIILKGRGQPERR